MTTQSPTTATEASTLPRKARTRWLMLALPAFALISAFATTAVARAGGWRGGPANEAQAAEWREKRVDRMLEGVEATPDQVAQIKAVMAARKGQWKQLHEERRQLHDSMRAALTAPTVNPAAVEAVRAKMVAQMEKSSRTFSEMAVEMGKILTQAQREQLAERMAQGRHHGPPMGLGF